MESYRPWKINTELNKSLGPDWGPRSIEGEKKRITYSEFIFNWIEKMNIFVRCFLNSTWYLDLKYRKKKLFQIPTGATFLEFSLLLGNGEYWVLLMV